MAIDVFVTYSPMDRLAATSLIRVLGTRGLVSWQPGVDTSADEVIPDRMSKLAGARAVAILFSKTTNQFKRITQEIAEAERHNLPVVFVNLGNANVHDNWAPAVAKFKLLQANRPPTDAQLDQIADELVAALGSSLGPDGSADIELEAELEPEGAGPEGSGSGDIELSLDLASEIDQAISAKASGSGLMDGGSGLLGISDKNKGAAAAAKGNATAKRPAPSMQKTRGVTPAPVPAPGGGGIDDQSLDLAISDDELSLDLSDIKPTSQSALATAPTQVIDAPNPKTLKEGISKESGSKKHKTPPPALMNSEVTMPDMGDDDSLLGKIKKKAVWIGAGVGVILVMSVGGVYLIRMSSGGSNPPPQTPRIAHNTTTAPASGTGASGTGATTKPDQVAKGSDTPPVAPAPVPDPATTPPGTDPNEFSLPHPSHAGQSSGTADDVVAPPVVIDKSAADIFSSDSGASRRTQPKTGTDGTTGGDQVAIATSSNTSHHTSSDPASVDGQGTSGGSGQAPSAGSKGVSATKAFGNAGGRSRLQAMMVPKPGEKAAPVAVVRPTRDSASLAAKVAKNDPENQAYKRDPWEFARAISEQISADNRSLEEVRQQAEDERADIQRQIERTSSEMAALRRRYDDRIAAVQPANAGKGDLGPLIMRASLEREKGDLDAARRDIDQVLKINPDEGLALKERARILDASNDPQGAVQSMDGAVYLLPRDDEAIAWRGRYWLKLGNVPTAIKSFDFAQQINPGQVLAMVGRGDAKMTRSEWTGALNEYVAALEINPRLYDALMGQGKALLKLRAPLKSLADFNEALDIKAGDAEPFARRAEAYTMLYNYGRALANANTAITVDPRSWQGHVARANVLAAMGHHGTAIKHLYWASGLNPSSAVPIAARGRVFMNMGDWDQAAAEFTAALNLDPGNLDAMLGNAQLCNRQGDYENAINWANRALVNDPGCPEAYVLRATVLRETNDPAGATEQALEVLKLTPNDPWSYLSLGITSLVGNSPVEADSYVIKAISVAPNLPQGYALRTIIAIDQNNLERARAFADEMMKKAPGRSESFYVKGLADLAWSNNQAALESADRALSLNSRNQGAMVLKARALINMDQPQKAIAVASEVLRWNENLVVGYVVRGRAYAASGDKLHAQDDFQKARELDPQLDVVNARLYAFDGF